MAKEISLIQTENPYIDKIIYYLKKLAVGCHLKNPTDVAKYETTQSSYFFDMYEMCSKGNLSWILMDYLDNIPPTVSITELGRTPKSIYDEIIDSYVWRQYNSNHIFWSNVYMKPVIEYWRNIFIIERANKNNTQPEKLYSFNGVVYKSLNTDGDDKGLYDAITEKIKSDYANFNDILLYFLDNVRSGRHHLLKIPRHNMNEEIEIYNENITDGSKYVKSIENNDFYIGESFTSNEEEQDRFLKYTSEYIIDNYIELNNYYRSMAGMPNVDEKGNKVNRIFLGVESYTVYENDSYYDIFYRFAQSALDNKQSDIINSPYVKKVIVGNNSFYTLWGILYLDELDTNQLQLLKSSGIINSLESIFPGDEYRYIKFFGTNSIDPIKARNTVDFGYLSIGEIDNVSIYNRFKDRLEINRMYTTKTIYSEAYKYGSDYYDHFICVLIVVLSMVDILSTMQEIIVNKEILDERIIKYIFESNGIPYYSEIPYNYQENMVKNLNTLIKYKSSNRNIVDICSLFGFDNIEVFKYYLLKIRTTDEEGNFTKINTDPITGEPTNLDKAYDLKFIKVPYKENVSDYINDSSSYIDYETMTKDDPYWNAGKDVNYIKNSILEKEFNIVKSKYISIDSTFEIAKATTEIAYLMNILYTDQRTPDDNTGKPTCRYLFKDFKVNIGGEPASVGDVFLYLAVLSFGYYGNIATPPTSIQVAMAESMRPQTINGVKSTLYDSSSVERSRYLDIDINKDLARLATLLSNKLNKGYEIYKENGEYKLKIINNKKTYYKNMIQIDIDNKYFYIDNRGFKKEIPFTEEELLDWNDNTNQTITHDYSGDIITLTEEEFKLYTSNMNITETDNSINIGRIPKVRMYSDQIIDENGNKIPVWKNLISVYYYENGIEVPPDGISSDHHGNTLYIVNNKSGSTIKFKIPSPINTISGLDEFLNSDQNSEGAMVNLQLIQSAMLDSSSLDEYNFYKWIMESIYTSNRIKNYFYKGTDSNNNPMYYSSYVDYLNDCKNNTIINGIATVAGYFNGTNPVSDDVKRESISNLINVAIQSLESIDFNSYFTYSYNGIATVSGDYMASYIIKLIDFFKSYKVDFHDINAVYKFDDKFNNTCVIIDQIESVLTSYNGIKDYMVDDEKLANYDKNKTISLDGIRKPIEDMLHGKNKGHFAIFDAISNIIISLFENDNNDYKEHHNIISKSSPEYSYYNYEVNDNIHKLLNSYVTLLLNKSFGTVENIKEFVTDKIISLGGVNSNYMNDNIDVDDIIYFVRSRFVSIMLLNNKIRVYDFDGTQNIIRNSDDTSTWLDAKFNSLSPQEKEEFFKEFETIDNIVSNISYKNINDEYIDNNILKSIIESIYSILNIDNESLFNNNSDSINMMNISFTKEDEYGIIVNLLNDYANHLYSKLYFTKYSIKQDIEEYLKLNKKLDLSSSCLVSIDGYGNTYHPINQTGFNTYQYIPIDLTDDKYDYYYLIENPTISKSSISSTAIVLYDDAWGSQSIKRYITITNAFISPVGGTPIKISFNTLPQQLLANAKYISIGIRSNENLTLFKVLKENKGDQLETFDKLTNKLSSKIIGNIFSQFDFVSENNINSIKSDSVEITDTIYISRAISS